MKRQQVGRIVLVALVAAAMFLIGKTFGQVVNADATTVRSEAAPQAEIPPTRDELLSRARYVVNDWREADVVMAQHSATEIQAMLDSNQIIVVFPPCARPWVDQTKALARYSCEGPIP